MSVLIKGMKMPSKCIRCPVNLYGRCLVNDDKDVSEATADAVRYKDCPLVPVPPHGRLISADELIEFIENRYEITWKDDYEGGVKDACVDILEKISTMPTVIPASEKEKLNDNS